ncbi:unnamed protein product [Rotaria socialis]|uniref:Nuclear RNA export factor 1 n=1 Tax=Rotaria socialis TaxID=392032 RepID=A0A817RE61_9BILA|nr:unnamed protein product [Rotaria socialis]CAF3358294.1 unnamed protein product [Rotaria socialis]CAF4105773.1 unnamed protein product [Rotaria socialis]CAF4167779.1 unnamed protein product [Rotaria socialis]
MCNRNNFTHRGGGKNYSDPISSRYYSKYNQRGGRKNYCPEPKRPVTYGDDVDTLMTTLNHTLTTNSNSTEEFSSTLQPQKFRPTRPTRLTRRDNQQKRFQINQTGWWRVSIQQAGAIGKDRVMSTLKAHCPRQFQAYHYFIDHHTKAGVFFVNSQHDANMIKRTNGEIEVQGLDILRIMVGRVSTPIPSLDEDLRPHFKDYLLRRRFNQQTFQLDLSNLADDEELSSLGIFPQFNKHAFIRDVIAIINKDIPMTRQLDFGSNNIMNLYEFRNLHLNQLMQLSFASNQLKNVEDFDNLKHLRQLTHIFIKNNPLTSPNNTRSYSMDDIISNIQQKLPQLKRIDDIDLAPTIRFATDIDTIALPKTLPYCVPNEMQGFLARFIEEFYRLFDTRGRSELHACYHDLCMFSLCITKYEDSHVPTRQFKYGGGLISDSRNLLMVNDNNKRINLLRHGKTAVLEYFTTKFPYTKHDGNSFHVDVITTANNRAIFTINGLYKEVDHVTHNPIRCFQRTFTCAQTDSGVHIIADHIMLTNATEAQISKMTQSSSSSLRTSNNQDTPNTNTDKQNQAMIYKFSQESGMNIEYSRLCLEQNNWHYNKAAEVYLDLKNQNKIPADAFNKS